MRKNAAVAHNYQGGALPLSYNSTDGVMPLNSRAIKSKRRIFLARDHADSSRFLRDEAGTRPIERAKSVQSSSRPVPKTPGLVAWIEARGGLSRRLLTMNGKQAGKMMRRCT